MTRPGSKPSSRKKPTGNCPPVAFLVIPWHPSSIVCPGRLFGPPFFDSLSQVVAQLLKKPKRSPEQIGEESGQGEPNAFGQYTPGSLNTSGLYCCWCVH